QFAVVKYRIFVMSVQYNTSVRDYISLLLPHNFVTLPEQLFGCFTAHIIEFCTIFISFSDFPYISAILFNWPPMALYTFHSTIQRSSILWYMRKTSSLHIVPNIE
ncbi:hypothetical protein L9F63_000574, partial [Diploptera punctata]